MDTHNVSNNTLQILINEAVNNRHLNPNTTFRPNLSNQGNLNQNILTRSTTRGPAHNIRQNRNFNYSMNRNNTKRQYDRRSVYVDLSIDKVSNIMSGWHVKFSGEECLFVDNFICRVHALTVQSLQADFETLCRHIHLLFTGKSLDSFWRFHQTCRRRNLKTLCREMKNQFRDRHTDFDLKTKSKTKNE